MLSQLRIVTVSICCYMTLTACDEIATKRINTTVNEVKKETTNIQSTSRYTSLADQYKGICPKLLQKRVDMSAIRRSDEQLKGEYCDYYLYPKKGQVLNITSKDSALDIYLRMPYLHDFANGKYLVKNNRRHVIRVSYAGSQLKPSDLTYNINIEFE